MDHAARLRSRGTALIICFSAIYACFSFIPAFPIVGLSTKAITLASVASPMIGLLLGPYFGMLATTLGGGIGLAAGHYSLPSLVSGIVTASFAGLLHNNGRRLCIMMYLSLLCLFGFYPSVGPIWLHPTLLWFQMVGFVLLLSTHRSLTSQDTLQYESDRRSPIPLFSAFLISTLAGQIAGSLIFVATSWPILIADLEAWKVMWQVLTWVYPIERIIIALGATTIAFLVHKTLISTNLMHLPYNEQTAKD